MEVFQVSTTVNMPYTNILFETLRALSFRRAVMYYLKTPPYDNSTSITVLITANKQENAAINVMLCVTCFKKKCFKKHCYIIFYSRYNK